jgi:hypothetical protein
VIVTFDTDEFRNFYPKFTPDVVTDAQLENFFALGCSFIDNTNKSIFPYDPDKKVFVRKQMLYLLVCHLATMETWQAGQSGPLTSASQGSVSVGFQNIQMWGQPWFSQTPCGRTLLMMLRPYALGGRIFGTCSFHPYG